MAGFLRRLRRPKEEEPAEEAAPEEESIETPSESVDGSEIPIPYRTEGEPDVAPPAEEPTAMAEPSTRPAERPPGPASAEPIRPDSGETPEPEPERTIQSRAPPGPATAVSGPTAPSSPARSVAPSLSAVAPVAPPAPSSEASASPPPLPEADRDAATSSIGRTRPTTRCFLCGTDMQGTFCPTCRMDWNE